MRYFYHLENGSEKILDEVGIEASSVTEARLAVEDVIREASSGERQAWHGWTLRVVDEAEDTAFTVDLEPARA